MNKIVTIAVIGMVALLAVNCQNKRVSSPSSSSGLRSVYFDFDNSFIRNDQVGALQGNAAYLKSTSGSVVVEGHCDERGSNEYNLALGQRRSDAGRDYLTNLGVGSGSMSTVSYGEEKPVCFDHDESCWWKNR